MKILPYAYHDGIPTMRDSDIKKLYDMMVRDGTDKTVFYDGMIDNRQKFLDFMQSSENMLLVVSEEGPVACGWLNHFEHKTAQAHFCVFSEGWPKAVEIGKILIDTALCDTGIDMLIGYIPDGNPGALKFAQKCGAQLLGRLPHGSVDENGKSHPTSIVYYTR
jgi:hypothetical protein